MPTIASGNISKICSETRNLVIIINVNPTFFPTSADFRKWLERNHETARELWVGFYRKSSGKPSITWPESVDVALCYGWIDGIRKTIDETSYKIRFTPRKPDS